MKWYVPLYMLLLANMTVIMLGWRRGDQLKAENDRLRAQNSSLKARNDYLRQRLNEIAAINDGD